MDGLIAGALRVLRGAGAEAPLIRVPGSFELPVVVKRVLQSDRIQAAVALGVVIRGGTPHFDYVCQAATMGLTQVALDTCRPVGFGVLTCDTEEQALARAGLPGSIEDKGAEAASAALATVAALATAADFATITSPFRWEGRDIPSKAHTDSTPHQRPAT
jgi:6,7-dimethyl-8-ribityllumazine synthase